jgi:hypothetical protein
VNGGRPEKLHDVKGRRLSSVVMLAVVLSAGAACSAPGSTSAGSSTSTSTTVQAAVESTSTSTTPAAVALPPPVPVALPDPAASRAPVSGSVASPAPTVAQLCTGSYVKKTTPSASVTDPIKAAQVARAASSDKDPSHYVEDQLVPIELGGAPTDVRNVWPQPTALAELKDREERRLRGDVCAGRTTLAAAQAQILAEWGPLPTH